MAKKRNRRQDRRHHHQSTQTLRRREAERRVEAAVESVMEQFAQLAVAAEDAAVTPEAFADRVVELLADDLCRHVITDSDFGADRGANIALLAGEERGRALTAALVGRVGGEPGLVWFVASLAESSGDLDTAERMLGDVVTSPDDRAAATAIGDLGRMWLEAGRLGDALEVLDRGCARVPEDEDIQALRARCLARAAAVVRIAGGDADASTRALADALGIGDPGQAEAEMARAALVRFADRAPVYDLREAVDSFVASHPDLLSWRDSCIGEFLSDAREAGGLGPFDLLGDGGQLRLSVLDEDSSDLGAPGDSGAAAGLLALAAERVWLSGPEPPDPEADLPDEQTVLGRFAEATATDPLLASRALSWLRHVRYGLWQPNLPAPGDPDVGWPSGGVWVVDLVTRRQVFAAIPPEQLDGLPRWSVLAGPLAPIDGIWRSGAALLALDPSQADRAAEMFLEAADTVVVALARERGIKVPGPRRRKGRKTRPHGVLAELSTEMEPAQADITAKVVEASLADLVGMVELDERRGPKLANTDGDPLELIRATYPTSDPTSIRARLAAQPDFEGDGDGEGEEDDAAPPLRWLGREMTATEAASSLAQLRAEAKARGWGPVAEPTGPKRWLRGTLRFCPSEVVVEVNSRQRLDAVTAALLAAGAGEPHVEIIMKPEMDLALSGRRLIGGSGGDPDVEAAWRASWLDESLPALEGRTPRAAAARPEGRVLLEALLRCFEYGADLAVIQGERPMDVEALRVELGMQDGAFRVEDGALGYEGDTDP